VVFLGFPGIVRYSERRHCFLVPQPYHFCHLTLVRVKSELRVVVNLRAQPFRCDLEETRWLKAHAVAAVVGQYVFLLLKTTGFGLFTNHYQTQAKNRYEKEYQMCTIYVPKSSVITQWSRGLPEKLTGFQLVKKFAVFYGTERFVTAFTRACLQSVSWARSIQSMPTSSPIHWRSILMLFSDSRLPTCKVSSATAVTFINFIRCVRKYNLKASWGRSHTVTPCSLNTCNSKGGCDVLHCDRVNIGTTERNADSPAEGLALWLGSGCWQKWEDPKRRRRKHSIDLFDVLTAALVKIQVFWD
jgi:hypothetical protein